MNSRGDVLRLPVLIALPGLTSTYDLSILRYIVLDATVFSGVSRRTTVSELSDLYTEDSIRRVAGNRPALPHKFD